MGVGQAGLRPSDIALTQEFHLSGPKVESIGPLPFCRTVRWWAHGPPLQELGRVLKKKRSALTTSNPPEPKVAKTNEV
jgi:hypothetical protein